MERVVNSWGLVDTFCCVHCFTTWHRDLASWGNQRGLREVWEPRLGAVGGAKGGTLADTVGQFALTFVAQVKAGMT